MISKSMPGVASVSHDWGLRHLTVTFASFCMVSLRFTTMRSDGIPSDAVTCHSLQAGEEDAVELALTVFFLVKM